jgi:cytochrome c oxidase subunit II
MRQTTIIGLVFLSFLIMAADAPVSSEQAVQVIKITAKRFEYSPNEIQLKKGVPVVLELTSMDVHHGFNCPDLKLREDIYPKKVTKVRIVPDKVGTFPFHCDVFCGEGHENMEGTIIVKE